MRIIAISREHSNREGIALVSEPPVTPEVFGEFQRHMSQAGSDCIALRLSAGHLIIQSDTFTPELRVRIERLLTEAHDIVSGAAARRQAERDAADRDLALESAAAGLGLPIQ